MKRYQFIFEATKETLTVRFLIISESFTKAKEESVAVTGIEFTEYNLESCKEMTNEQQETV